MAKSKQTTMLTIYNTTVHVTSQEQADRLKQVCVDYWLPIWIYNAAFKILKSDVKPIFCFVRPEFFITDLYDLDDDDDILTYSEITESEWMELLTKTKKL